MSHDQAWGFMALGRLLERADMTARLVATGALPQAGPPWSTVLQSCGAQQAYLRTNRGLIRDDRVAAFLVLDRQFPRSVLLRPVRCRAPAGGDRPGDAPDGHPGRGPPPARPDPDQPRVPARPRRHGRPARADASRPGRRDWRVRRCRPPLFPAGTVTTWVEDRVTDSAGTASSTRPRSATTGGPPRSTTSCG